ncbi:MAG TPA: zinc ribbon domain-containing protein [Pirellulales bacterium]|nr:zinc ribbon domain-containing protein [Pirellulales bacterium]
MQNSKVLLWVGLGCGGLALVSLAACGGFLFLGLRAATGNGEVSTKVDELFREVDAGDFAKTYQTETSPELRRVTSEADYVRLGRLIKTRLGALKSKQVSNINMRQVNATSTVDVTYTATFERGTGTIHAVFVKSLGNWQLNQLQVNSPEFAKDFSTAVCPKCGEPHAESAKFCPKCGEKLPQPPPADAEQPR